jgi:Tfp pilus assembly protein PilZ
MRSMRKHKRFKLDLIDLNSKISLVGKVEIIDISLGGVALKADRKLNIGKECLIMLGHEGKPINVKGVVVRSELSGIEERAEGNQVTIYSMGILFNDASTGKVKDFLASIENHKKTPVPSQADWFSNYFRLRITTPSEKVLDLPTHFGVKEINQSGVIIQTDHHLKIDSMVLLELSLNACDSVSFMGKVVTCHRQQDKAHANYDIGIQFLEITDRDRSLLTSFIECVEDNKNADNERERKD